MKNSQAQETDEINSELSDDTTLSPKQELALGALLSNPTRKDAAQAAGISETTLWRYMQDAAFKRRLREARREAHSHTTTRLQSVSSDAVMVLHNLMMSEGTPALARVSAAGTILYYGVQIAGMDELQERVEGLEEFVSAKQEEEALDSACKGIKDNET